MTSDTLNTPRVVTKADGSVKSRHDYLPFGEEVAEGIGGRSFAQHQYIGMADGVKQKFTGYESDIESNLAYAQARYYANQNGRFTSPDPALSSMAPIEPQSMNKYSYGLNNPLKYTDPSGLYICNGTTDECNAFETQRSRMEKRYKSLNPKSKEYQRLQRAIDAYGQAGVDNGVTVKFAANQLGKPLNTTGYFKDNNGQKATSALNPTGQDTTVTVDLNQLGGLQHLDGDGLATGLSHEGSHVADRAQIIGSMPLAWANVNGLTTGALQALQSSLNNQYNSEMTAYQVTIAATQVLTQASQGNYALSLGSGKNTIKVWESSWGDSDNKKSLQQIDKHLSTPKASGGYGLTKGCNCPLLPY